jgi:hypothetical protein
MRDTFSLETTVDRLESLYERVVAERAEWAEGTWRTKHS